LSGAGIHVPIRVWRGKRAGPVVFVTGAVHGDEINGAGTIRQLILDPPFELAAGTLVLVPVANTLAFERHARYLPDRRDLNRCFPGSRGGSLASRIARQLFTEVVERCDFGIDLHSAGAGRTNFPNVRGDLDDPGVARLAHAFGCEVVLHGAGPGGSLRRAACEAGRPAILLEAGEVWKVEPGMVAYGVRGIRNVLIELGLVEGEPEAPLFRAVVDRASWVRAEVGGFLEFHVSPGQLVRKGDALATNSSMLGEERNVLLAPEDALVIGMTTQPAVVPGLPVCHLGVPRDGVEPIARALKRRPSGHLLHRVRRQLSRGMVMPRPRGS
jgi:predicted deacylase